MHSGVLWEIKTCPEQVRWHMRRKSRCGIDFDVRFVALGEAALARAHFVEEAWDTVICGTKSTWAMFTHIISKASLQPSFDLNCASIFCRNQWKIVQKVVPNGIFLWLGL